MILDIGHPTFGIFFLDLKNRNMNFSTCFCSLRINSAINSDQTLCICFHRASL